MARIHRLVYVVLDVVVDAGDLSKVGAVENLCKGLLSETPGVVDGTDAGPVTWPTLQDALVRGKQLLGWLDDVEQGDLLW
jgi:hypothetical protein